MPRYPTLQNSHLSNKLKNIPTIEKESKYALNAHPTFTDNNPNLNGHPMLVYTEILCNNTTLPLIIINNSNKEVCIRKGIPIGTTEEINRYCYNINEIILTAWINDTEID